MTKAEQKRYDKIQERIAGGEIIEQKCWKMIREINSFSEERLNSAAMIYNDREYTYRQMFRQWERYAEVFSALNITEENHSRAGVVSTPSLISVFTFYGLNMTGVSASMISFMDITDMKQLGKLIRTENITDLILSDFYFTPQMLRKILGKKEKWGLNNIIVQHIPMEGPFCRRELQLYSRINEHQLRRIPGIVFMDDLLDRFEATPICFGREESADAAIILHTSGTTSGIHKPVPLSDRALNESTARMLRDERFRELEGKVVCGLGLELAGSYSAVDMMHLPLTFGGTIVILPLGQMDVEMFGLAISHYKMTILFSSDIMMEFWMKSPVPLDFSSLSHIFAGGSYLSPESKKRYDEFLRKCGAKAGISIGYGLSEAGASCILASPDRTDDAIGYPLPGVRVKIFDEEENRYYNLEDGPRTGVLFLSTPSLSNGCIDNDVFFTLDEIDGEAWLNTYDLVQVNEDGSLSCIGRMNKFFVNNDGIRFDAGLVETAVSAQPGIRACGLAPSYNKSIHDTIPVLYVQTTGNERNAPETVRQALRNVFIRDNRIVETNLPGQCVITDEIPYTVTGKVDVYRIKKEGINGAIYAIIPVRKQGKLVDIRIEATGFNGVNSRAGVPDELASFFNPFVQIEQLFGHGAASGMGQKQKGGMPGFPFGSGRQMPGGGFPFGPGRQMAWGGSPDVQQRTRPCGGFPFGAGRQMPGGG
ncbi:MAG: class I adenylate-forming enzyme family protein, partial [Eubacteriales bacterium]|nr:class I adenylate-forming enzyme family protein [Eubacteriales bacterium]